MTRLLVSVRNADEAALALAAGVGVVDVKEPVAGSLGAASREAIAEVAQCVAGRAPLSVACGELRDARSTLNIDRRADYAKLGLAGCDFVPDWQLAWRQALQSLPPATRPVAVVYADWRTCAAPSPQDVLDAAVDVGCAGLLVDTFDKTRGGLFANCDGDELGELIAAARAARLFLALAGSLDRGSLPAALALRPDLIAVRGCVCRGGRTGALDAGRLAEIVALVAGNRQAAAAT